MWKWDPKASTEYKGYKYDPEYDHDNDRSWYYHTVRAKHATEDIWVDAGYIDVGSISPTYITQEVFEMWVDAGMPSRKHKTKDFGSPLKIKDIEDLYWKKINEEVDKILIEDEEELIGKFKFNKEKAVELIAKVAMVNEELLEEVKRRTNG